MPVAGCLNDDEEAVRLEGGGVLAIGAESVDDRDLAAREVSGEEAGERVLARELEDLDVGALVARLGVVRERGLGDIPARWRRRETST